MSINLTAAEYREYQRTGKLPKLNEAGVKGGDFLGSAAPALGDQKKVNHRTQQTPGKMNKTEEAFASEYLTPLVQEGVLLQWLWEPFRLRLAANTFYVPDFAGIAIDGVIVYEVKGTHVEDDAKAKWKIAGEIFWWMTFKMVKIKMSRGRIESMDWTEYTR